MIFIAHRINTSQKLKTIPITFGVEIDLRDNKDGLYLSHDPFTEGESFKNYINHFNHKFLIINIKSYGIEKKCIKILNEFKIYNYFFLDSCMSSVVNHLHNEKNN